MSSTPTLVQATGSPVRPRPFPKHRQMKSTSNIPTVSQPNKPHKNKGNKPQRPSTSQAGPIESNLTKSLKMVHQLQHASSEPHIAKHNRTMTPPTTPAPNKLMAKAYQSDGNISSSEKTGRKRRNPRKGRDISLPTQKTPPVASDSPPHSADESAMPSNTPGRAYAGPTFHHSPAPSALPLPGFLSKSVPALPKGPSLTTMMAEDSSENDSPPPAVEESPLAKLFRADSEERARRRNQGQPATPSKLGKVQIDGPLSPSYMNVKFNPFHERPHTPPSEFVSQGTDLFFNMDNIDKRPSPVASPFEKQSNYQAVTSPQDASQHDAIRRRREKAMALKEVLLRQSPNQGFHQKNVDFGSPSPKPRAGFVTSPLNEQSSMPVSPTHQRHYQQRDQNIPAFHTKSTAASLPRSEAQNMPPSWPGVHNQSNASPLQKSAAPKDPKALEDYLRWALKIDTPT